MTRVARLLRDEGLDASSASAIEAVRLAEALAALRDRHLPGLEELNEAAAGDLLLRRRRAHAADPPQADRRRAARPRPRRDADRPAHPGPGAAAKAPAAPPDPAQTTKVLDLREANDLERSRLLHRLGLLGVPWGTIEHASGKGTFKEAWRLQWQPEFAVSLIEASLWGTTVIDAASAKADDLAEKAPDLPALTDLLDRAILADLPASVERIMARLEARAAVASDVTQLMNALPPLANLLRYGNVRKTDAATVAHATSGIVARVCVGLPGACSSLDDDAAAEMFGAIQKADAALGLIEDAEHLRSWHATLAKMSGSDGLHGLVAGRCVRILLDARVLDPDEAARRMNLAVSTAAGPPQAAAWIDGFLRGSGELLYHDDALFGIFDGWLASLPAEAFPQLLPLLRRTFSTFEGPLRRNLGEKARRGATAGPAPARRPTVATDFDDDRAARVLPLLAAMLGLDSPEAT